MKIENIRSIQEFDYYTDFILQYDKGLLSVIFYKHTRPYVAIIDLFDRS
jgi:hypothetical protein